MALTLLATAPVAAASPSPDLGRAEGFGAGTTGGAGGAVYWVTNLSDDGPGSLRAGAEGPDAAVIRFRVSGVISLGRHLNVGPNKTLDGRGADVTIAGRGVVLEQPNVIIAYMKFAEFGNLANPEDREDAILISGAHNVWIDHCTLTRAGDKAIGIPRGTDITVSWNRFVELGQVIQIGTFSTAEESRNTRVTVHHNSFDSDKDRNPQVSYGKVHAYNNQLRDWQVKGIGVIRGAELYSQANVFAAGNNKKAIVFKAGIPESKDPGVGYVRSVDDLLLNGAIVDENEPQRVFDPAEYYSVDVEPASESLAERVRADAGWHAVALPEEPGPSMPEEQVAPDVLNRGGTPAPPPPSTSVTATRASGGASPVLVATIVGVLILAGVALVLVRQSRGRSRPRGPGGGGAAADREPAGSTR